MLVYWRVSLGITFEVHQTWQYYQVFVFPPFINVFLPLKGIVPSYITLQEGMGIGKFYSVWARHRGENHSKSYTLRFAQK
jgi:hypothetical protein